MSIEAIKNKLAAFRQEWEASRGCADMTDFSDDVACLLEQNQRLVEEVERLQNELSGRNKMNESEWNVVVSGAQLIQSTYPKQSIGWIRIQRLIVQYADGDRSDDLKEALNKVE